MTVSDSERSSDGSTPAESTATDGAGPLGLSTGSAPQSTPSGPRTSVGLAKSSAINGDSIFKWVAYVAGGLVLVLVAGIAIELVVQAIPALTRDKTNFLTSSEWTLTTQGGGQYNLRFGIWDLFKVTVLSSLFALLLAVPFAIGIATFLVFYAPKRASRFFSGIVDLLAAVPSIVYGVWGIVVLAPALLPVMGWLNSHIGWLFLFSDGNIPLSSMGNIFVAGIVLAVMILPIITSISREVLRQTPMAQQEAATALGATRWEVIRMTAFPYARSGVIAGSMLALGRALGETVAVLIILKASFQRSHFSLFDGGYTFASKIASGSAEFNDPVTTGAYIAAGLVLFILTFVVNAVARRIAGGKVNR